MDPERDICTRQVTALAAVQKLEGKGNIMGISMGSSEGAGYANKDGSLGPALVVEKVVKVGGMGLDGVWIG